jgi:hypothetical protein
MKLLPIGTTCKRMSAMGITGYVVQLPTGQAIGSGGNAATAWSKAENWALRNQTRNET